MIKKTGAILFLLFIGGCMLMGENRGGNATVMGSLLPKEINGWTAEEEDKTFGPETIFDYIDGAGEVYRAFHFRALLARQYVKESSPDIIADIFDMGSSRNAYGVFTHDLEGEEPGIGQDSTYKGGLLTFWKGRFFVSLYAEEETEEAKTALLDLGKKVASSIEEEGERPQLLSLLPQKNLLKKRVRFFFNHLILNYHFFVADENILHIDASTDVVLGVYRENGETFTLLLVRYPDTEKALLAHKNFVSVYMPDAPEPGFIQTEDGTWTGISMKKDVIILVFNARIRAHAAEMIRSAEERIKGEAQGI
jgi:hypothetical protein